jgi:hypothetical protein
MKARWWFVTSCNHSRLRESACVSMPFSSKPSGVRHASDVQVEDREYEAIADTLTDIEDAQAKKREKLLHDQQQSQLEELQAPAGRGNGGVEGNHR